MKRIPFLLALLCLPLTSALGQSFEITVTPEAQSIRPGATAEYSIRVNPTGGYKATVYLRASFLSSLAPAPEIRFSPDRLNFPYTADAAMKVNTSSAAPGRHTIMVEAWNGNLFARDTVTLDIDPNSPNGAVFTLEVTPEVSGVMPGQKAVYQITVGALGGFADSVNLHVFYLPLGKKEGPTVKLMAGVVRPPYPATTTMEVTGGRGHIGRHALQVEGWVGMIFVRDTCYVDILTPPELRGWTIFNTINSPLVSSAVYAIEHDRNGAHWLMTGRGLMKIDGSGWKYYGFPKSSGIDTSYSDLYLLGRESLPVRLSVDSNDAVWAVLSPYRGNDGDGMIIRLAADDTWGVQQTGSSGLPLQSIRGISVTPDGQTWVATFGHWLMQFVGLWERTPKENTDVPDIQVLDFAIDRTGTMWLMGQMPGTTKGVLGRYDGQFWSSYVAENLGFPTGDASFADLTIDDQNNIWIASSNYGVAKFDGIDATYYPQTKPRTGIALTCIDVDPMGNAWVGSTNGLLKLAGQDTTWFRHANSLLPVEKHGQMVNVKTVNADRDGRIWVGTENGLALYDPRTAGVESPREERGAGMIASVYPHPVDEASTIRLTVLAGSVRLSLVNALGESVVTLLDGTTEPGERTVLLRTAGLASGTYFLKLIVDGRTEVRPIIVR